MRTVLSFLVFVFVLSFSSASAAPNGRSPLPYDVIRNDAAGTLTLSTPFYTFRHNLKKGGALDMIRLTHGRAENLLVTPIEAGVRVTGKDGGWFGELNVSDPKVTAGSPGKLVTVGTDCLLRDGNGRDAGIRLRTTYEYHWGFVKVKREFVFPRKPVKIGTIGVFDAVVHPSLEQYGYRQAISDQEGTSPFGFGVMQWGKMRSGAFFDPPLQTRFVPRYLALLNPGIEGFEWFVGDTLSQWEYQTTGKPGTGWCTVRSSISPLGVGVQVRPLAIEGAVAAKASYTFDSYIGIPVLEGHANKPWLHAAFNRNKGAWVSPEQVKKWADSGIRTVHCHNDGDAYNDGLFWHDGTYPPYPPEDMKKYNEVIESCHKNGIRVATYFSNKELHPVTDAFKAHGEEWGRKPSDTGLIAHNRYNNDEFGAQMCLKSGWLDQLKTNVDTVLKNHRLDGVYYDWNVGLFCANPLHVGKKTPMAAKPDAMGTLALGPDGHWDIDELVAFMEWTRERVGPEGLIIVHDTMSPMFATENFADYVVGMEWGYGLLSRSVPPVTDLPAEWTFAGARSRAVIGYGTLAPDAPKRLGKLLALETLLTGSAPWPASPEAIEFYSILGLLGDIESYRFEDWRNTVVTASDGLVSAVYSRPGEAYILLGNTGTEHRLANLKVNPSKLPFPLEKITAAELISSPIDRAGLDATLLTGKGAVVPVYGDDVIMVRVK